MSEGQEKPKTRYQVLEKDGKSWNSYLRNMSLKRNVKRDKEIMDLAQGPTTRTGDDTVTL